MKVIGLTGGIGSGKSTVAAMFNELGISVYNADQQAKMLVDNSEEIRTDIIDLFGQEAYGEHGLNRVYLADIVFDNREKLEQLNSIIHPAVEVNFREWIKRQSGPYVIQENPLIYENKKQNAFDQIILVTAPEPLRIQRVIKRDAFTKEQVKARIANQLSEKYKVKKADYVIHNINIEDTKKNVNYIHEQLVSLKK